MTPGLRNSDGEGGHSESPALCSPETLKQLVLIWYFLVTHHYYKALWVAVTFSSLVSPGKGQGDRRKSRGGGAVSDDTAHLKKAAASYT